MIRRAVSPHWLRHAYASHALDRGAPISLVQSTLGRASVTTTGRYLHVRPEASSARYLPVEEALAPTGSQACVDNLPYEQETMRGPYVDIRPMP